MSIVENSMIYALLSALFTWFIGLWRESWLHGVFLRVGDALRRGVEGSRICHILCREGVLERFWPESRTCRLVMILVNLPCALVKWVYRKGKTLWDGSFLFRTVTALGGGGAALVGLTMLVMLSAPHAAWNNVYALLLVVAVAGVYWLGTAGSDRRLDVDLLGPYFLFFFAFLCIALVSSLAFDLSLRFFLFHLTGVLIVVLLVSATRTVGQVQGAVAVAAGGVLVSSLYGCYQGIIGVKVVASQQDMTVNAGMPGRVYSFFDNPNNFAEILVMLLPLLLALFLNSESFRGRVFSLICLGVGVVAIGYTYSRSGWLGLLLALFLFLAMQNWRVVPVAVVLGVLAVPFLPETILNRFLTIGNLQDSSTRYRFAIYEATGNLMKDYWLRGVGLGSDVMTKTFKSYPTMFDGNHPIHTHNNYLQMWGELGLFGGITYIALVFGHLKKGVKAFYAAENRKVRNLLSAALGSFSGILLISIAEYTWFYPRNMFVFYFLFGIIAACIKLTKLEK